MQLTGKRGAGNPHAAFDKAGAEDGLIEYRASPQPYLRGLETGNSLRLPDQLDDETRNFYLLNSNCHFCSRLRLSDAHSPERGPDRASLYASAG